MISGRSADAVVEERSRILGAVRSDALDIAAAARWRTPSSSSSSSTAPSSTGPAPGAAQQQQQQRTPAGAQPGARRRSVANVSSDNTADRKDAAGAGHSSGGRYLHAVGEYTNFNTADFDQLKEPANAQELCECLEQLQFLSQRRGEQEDAGRASLYRDIQTKYGIDVASSARSREQEAAATGSRQVTRPNKGASSSVQQPRGAAISRSDSKFDVSIPFPSESWGGAGGRAEDSLPTASAAPAPQGQDITIEEFQKRMVWEKVTGNLPCPADSFKYFHSTAVDTSIQGEEIGIVKPSTWTLSATTSHRDMLNMKRMGSGTPGASRASVAAAAAGTQGGTRGAAETMSFVDFVRSIPLFHSLQVQDILDVEKVCIYKTFRDGTVIVREGTLSSTVYLLREGGIKVTKAGSPSPFYLSRGDYFGECALTGHPSTSSYIVTGTALLVCIPAKTFEFVLSTAESGGWTISQQLRPDSVGFESTSASSVSASAEILTLGNHIDHFLDVMAMFKKKDPSHSKQPGRAGGPASKEKAATPEPTLLGQQKKSKRRSILQYTPVDEVLNTSSSAVAQDQTALRNEALMLELLTSLSPELSFDDITERICRLTKEFFDVDRVGFFLVDAARDVMTLKVSQDNTGFSVPLKGIAGHIARTGESVNLPDCYQDPRFDPAMDVRTGYRTKQMLCVPVLDGTGRVAGVLQIINPLRDTAFTTAEEVLLRMAAEQIGSALNTMKARTTNAIYTPIYAVSDVFKLQLSSAFILRSHNHLRCEVRVYHGGVLACEPKNSSLIATNQIGSIRSGNFDQWITFDTLRFSMLPQACRVIFTLFSKNNHPVGWCGLKIFDFEHVLKTGEVTMYLWDGECPSPNAPSLENLPEPNAPSLSIVLPTFPSKIVYEVNSKPSASGARKQSDAASGDATGKPLDWYLSRMSPAEKTRFLNVMNDPIVEMSQQDKNLIWRMRHSLVAIPEYLPKFLMAVNWFSDENIAEAHRLLYAWAIPSYVEALQLLDHKFPDPRVRAYAVQLLGSLDDDELHSFLLQLVQLLKFEPFLDGALVRFLFRRAFGNPEKIGHTLFWFLRAEVHIREVAPRFGVYLDLYMRKCGAHRTHLGHQLLVLRHLETVSQAVLAAPTKEARLEVLRQRLSQIDFPSSFQLPLNPNLRVRGLIVDKCRVMESKKKPLWLTFQNADPKGAPIVIMFKCGDDLRQDQLTLQVLSVMDGLWRQEGRDLRMSAYKCISTSKEVGMLEIVENASTLANIVSSSRDDSGSFGVGDATRKLMAAIDALYRDDVLIKWLQLSNVDFLHSQKASNNLPSRDPNLGRAPRRNAFSGPSCPEDPDNEGMFLRPGHCGLDVARENFLLSCAGYCVATFVLGIGDRHNDNIMLKRTGELFHIDFGHFLGNFKWKYGIKRERAPFVFTPAFAAILGGQGSDMYRRFEDMCVEAFLILRRNSSLLVTLFSLMVSCGIPELQREEDVAYLKDNLMCFETDAVASQRLREVIAQCLHTRTTQLNDAAHLLKHA